jgi:predicted acylesterase/phospholipase RssA
MKIFYSLPFSGGQAPNQFQLLLTVYHQGLRPDVVFATSGGAVAIHFVSQANWDEQRLRELIRESVGMISIRRKNIAEQIKALISPENNSFLSESGTLRFFTDMMSQRSAGGIEIWNGTLNDVSNKSAFFCNTSKSSSRFNFESDEFETIFCNNDKEMFAKSVKASMSIPPLFPKTEINGCQYIDGAFGWASPIVPMLAAANVTEPHSVVVIDGKISQLTIHNTAPADDMVGMFSKYIKRLTHQKISSDVFFLVQRLGFLARINGETVCKKEIINPTEDDWRFVRDTVYSSRYSVLVVSPLYYRAVQLYEIDYDKTIDIMNMCKKYVALTLHYSHKADV